MATLKGALDAWNNLYYKDLVSQWKFLVFDSDEPVGYVPDNFADRLHWDDASFEKNSATKTIRLRPRICNGDEPSIDVCNWALADFCEQNQDVSGFAEALKPWAWKRIHATGMKLSYHPVFTPRKDLKGLKVPSPARGIFGIMTAGVHLNAYTVKEGIGKNGGTVDRIWVAKRSQATTFPGCFDQIVAGGMDLADEGDPLKTLRHEAEEEAMWKLEDNGTVIRTHHPDTLGNDLVGEVQDAGRVYFCTRKDKSAGAREEDHIEPGVRFCFDLQVILGIEPVPDKENKSIERFFALSVAEVIESLEDRKWKPNSGLVMLDFLHRYGLVDENKCEGIKSLSNMPPLPLPEFPHSQSQHRF